MFLDPSLDSSKGFNLAVILIIYWGATLINFKGTKLAGWFSTAGVIGGTIFPAALIIILGIVWALSGNSIEFMKDSHAILPDFSKFSSIAFLAGIVTLFSGMEVGAVHVRELKDPKSQYQKATFLAMFIIIIVFTLGSLAIATVIPQEQISLTAGILQAFKDLLNKFDIGWLLPVIGFLAAFGAIGGVTAWIAGPSKGLLSTAKDGVLPPFLQHTNKKGVQTHILYVQGSIVTVISLAYIFMPSINSAFFILSALTAILYLLMYILLYAAAIKLRYSKPDVERTYKVPGGNAGMWIVSGLGILAAVFAIIVGFFPPSQLTVGSPLFYVAFLAVGVIIFIGAPLLIHSMKKPDWMPKNPEITE
jgi:amino acid transporter